MNKTINFGETLRMLRVKAGFSLRDINKETGYDPSNWSKIERGLMLPPKDEVILERWVKALKIEVGSKEHKIFIDKANIAQGSIPQDILADKSIVDCLPAFFRTVRNKKPTNEDINLLINAIKDK